MAYQFKDLTKSYCTDCERKLTSFSRLVECDLICISPDLPPINKILSSNISYNVKSSKLINTPVAVSLEGQTLTGYKILVELETTSKIIYESSNGGNLMSASLTDTKLHSCYVIVPATYKGFRVCDLIRNNKFIVNPITEYFATRVRNECCINTYLSVIIDVQLY